MTCGAFAMTWTKGDALAERDRERLGGRTRLEVLTRPRRTWLAVAGRIAAYVRRGRGAMGRPGIPGGMRTC